MTLDDPRTFQRADPHRVAEILAAFPAQCREAQALRCEPPVPRERPSLVIIAGMGGSAAGADLLAACGVEQLDVPILVHRGYGLPAAAGKHTLVVTASYSGETAEVLSAADAALGREIPVVTLSAGGRLAELAESRRLPHLRLPGGLMPRMALGYLFFALARVLTEVDLVVATHAELAEAVTCLEPLARELAPTRATAQNEAKRLALAIGDRLPAVYGGPATGAVAYRWKTDLEENAKLLALAGTLPEMTHNEIEAWRGPAARDRHLVLLREEGEPREIARRFAVLHDLIGPAAGGVSECWARGTGRAARLLALAYVGMWVSYYAAIARGVDPWPVPLLDEVKRRLA
jgi:glucose/mannose-6-phosphate isomerase